ncbi:hypothetical protein BC826DRAFT_188450 [Russula brevipes]|nr:hypothetical protein BC826DRAFT_188450 [Russula brevipes]
MAPLHSPGTHSIPSPHTHTHSEPTIKLCIDRSFCPLTHIPADMGGGTYGYPDLHFSMESVSAVDVHSSVPGVLQNAYPLIRTKAYAPDFHRRGRPALNQGTNEGAETPHPEYNITGICDGDVSAVHLLDSRLRTMFYPSTLGGSRGFVPAPVIVNRDIIHVDSDLTRTDATGSNAFREGTLTNIPPVREAQEQQGGEQGEQRNQRPQFQKKSRGAAAPSPSSLQPPSISGPPNSPYSCNDCGKTFAQSQGVSRHRRETHGASLCMICRSFEWGRPYRLREHLKKRHPDVDPDKALAQATKAQRRATMTARRRPKRPVSPRTHHDDATDKATTQTQPPPAVTELLTGYPSDLFTETEHRNLTKVGAWTAASLLTVGAAPWW